MAQCKREGQPRRRESKASAGEGFEAEREKLPDLFRYLLPVTSQFIIKWPSSSFGRSASSTRPRSVFTARMGHF